MSLDQIACSTKYGGLVKEHRKLQSRYVRGRRSTRQCNNLEAREGVTAPNGLAPQHNLKCSQGQTVTTLLGTWPRIRLTDTIQLENISSMKGLRHPQ